MKKRLFVLFIVVLSVSAVFSSQITYRRDSAEVKTYYALRYLTGVQTPDPVFPISGSQLSELLKEMNTDNLGDYSMSLYERLLQELDAAEHTVEYKKSWMDISLPFNTQIRGRSSDVDLSKTNNKAYDFLLFNSHDSIDGHGIDVSLGIGENFAGRFNYSLAYPDSKEFRNDSFLFISPFFAFETGDENHKPYQAYASIGNEVLNFIAGRDRTSAGNGVTGNIAFGDNLVYQDFAKFSAVSYPFSYDLTAYVFDNQKNSNFSISPYLVDEDFQVLVSHRFSSALSKRISVSLYESTLSYGDSFSAIKCLNPFMILHNTYSFKNSNLNNFCGAELNLSVNNFEISAAFMLDQYQFDFEIYKPSMGIGPKDIAPNAWAAQLNTKGAWEYKQTIVQAFGELTYTSPVCYLKELHGKVRDSEDYWWYQQDLLVSTVYDDSSNVEFVGYKYGPNTVSLGFGLSTMADRWSFSANALLMERGSYGRNFDVIKFGKDLDMTDEESEAYIVAFSPYLVGSDKVEYSVQTVLKGTYSFNERISLSGGAGFIHVSNLNNKSGSYLDDFQFSVSVTVDLLEVSRAVVPFLKDIRQRISF